MINLETGTKMEMPSDRISDLTLKPIVKLLELYPEGVYSEDIQEYFGETKHELWSSLVRLHKLNVIENYIDHRRTENRGKAYWKIRMY